MNKKIIALISAVAMLSTACGAAAGQPQSTSAVTSSGETSAESVTSTAAGTTASESAAETAATEKLPEKEKVSLADIRTMKRPRLLGDEIITEDFDITPKVDYITPAEDLSNVYFGDYDLANEYDRDKIPLLAKNGFILLKDSGEFYEVYEHNRYWLRANYVTVDSLMHTYNVYFMHLMRTIESEVLSDELLEVSKNMLNSAQFHYDKLKGTEWETAAARELAYFAVGASLLGADVSVPDEVWSVASEELELIKGESGITFSPLLGDVPEDYSQYKPRGNYESTEQLKKYFKAMMWYGRIAFRTDDEELNRTAMLITMSMNEDLEQWSEIYQVTSFFAGESDDTGYYEFMPLIDAAYGENITVDDIIGKSDEWQAYHELCQNVEPPKVNGAIVFETDSDEEQQAAQKGFRFMGQRFSIDEAVFTQLVFRQVKENEETGKKRMLPDALDFPAALGSDTALSILESEGKTDYPNFNEQMGKARKMVNDTDDATWHSNLYFSWINTIRPLIEDKGEAYPPFMRTDAWKRKSLLSFLGSYTELKHATLLYNKQVMAEMGGAGPEEEFDDRGYVECEPVIFARLEALSKQTANGLDKFGMIKDNDMENLLLLSDLSGKLKTIALKELNGELPTDEEFELIRTYGGQLEHFWQDAMDADYPDEEYHDVMDHPPAYIADIATQPGGDDGSGATCLEVGTAYPFTIYTIVQVDGQLKIASGSVFSFYQFEQPADERMTDTEWRILMGIQFEYDDDWNTTYDPEKVKPIPDWYSDIKYKYEWEK